MTAADWWVPFALGALAGIVVWRWEFWRPKFLELVQEVDRLKKANHAIFAEMRIVQNGQRARDGLPALPLEDDESPRGPAPLSVCQIYEPEDPTDFMCSAPAEVECEGRCDGCVWAVDLMDRSDRDRLVMELGDSVLESGGWEPKEGEE